MKMHHIKIGGKTLSAAFNLNALEKLAEMAGPDEDGKPLDAQSLMKLWTSQYGIIRCLVVLIREGERLEGRETDIDEQWIKDNASPGEGIWMQRKVCAILVEGMSTETMDDDEEEVDEVLEEIKKKVMKGGSPSGSSEPGAASPD